MRKHIDFAPKGAFIHKTVGSPFYNHASSGKRETKCEKEIDQMECHSQWKYVTCPKCLEGRKNVQSKIHS